MGRRSDGDEGAWENYLECAERRPLLRKSDVLLRTIKFDRQEAEGFQVERLVGTGNAS